jgi:hypothetical protein
VGKNRIDFQFLGDARDLINATRGAQGALDRTETAADRTDRAMGRFDDTIKNLALGIGAAELGKFAYEAIQMGEQADQVAESARTVLGPELETLRKNLEDVRGAMGLNVAELDTLAAQFGLLTESMGLTDSEQATFIENLVNTGGDLAAFRGDVGQAQEAIDSLAGAYKGEFDSLENWGIKLSAAEVELRKVEIAARDGSENLSDQQLELMAITELIEERSAPAFGSLAEAQETAAGQANELKTKWEDLQIKVGQFLAPALDWLLTLVLDGIEAWGRLTDAQEFWNTRLGVWYKKLDDFTHRVLEPFGKVIRAIRDAVGWLIEKFETLIGVLGRVKFPSVPSWVPFIGDDGGGGRQLGGTPAPKGISGGGPLTGGGSRTINVNVEAGLSNPQSVAQTVVETLQVYEQTNGTIPITVRGWEQ